MFASNDVFRMASALAAHAAARQTAISQNMANADTPGYRAMDARPFSDTIREAPALALRRTRPAHLGEPAALHRVRLEETVRPGDASPNGNSVSLEREMLNAAETKHSHDLALTVYRSGLTLLRSSLGRG
ncbi:FlgB family protein [Mangrovicoccus algicola]|uniref:FlgB family protein n=1 Tax=Mangrovicoccus algicola TaxID=2771008 RepID=A0A8J7CZ04_9RHOB|nr:FlgB family protein [Mangrovicoccus algicola]MBE3640227.1 FlgB family protein [Mangrovicoccus algicola]